MMYVFDAKGRYVKKVFSKYANQLVIKGHAVYISSSAIQLVEALIAVFPCKGVTMTKQQAMSDLVAWYSKNNLDREFAIQRASAALGGGSSAGTLAYSNGYWTRVA